MHYHQTHVTQTKKAQLKGAWERRAREKGKGDATLNVCTLLKRIMSVDMGRDEEKLGNKKVKVTCDVNEEAQSDVLVVVVD